MIDTRQGPLPVNDEAPGRVRTGHAESTGVDCQLQALRPRWRRDATGETSRSAALAGPRITLRERVLERIETAPAPLTCEEVLADLRANGIRTTLSGVRARCSELGKGLGLIADSGLRGRSDGGLRAIRWRATTELERAAWPSAETNGDAA
jgi:hypothetical protein